MPPLYTTATSIGKNEIASCVTGIQFNLKPFVTLTIGSTIYVTRRLLCRYKSSFAKGSAASAHLIGTFGGL